MTGITPGQAGSHHAVVGEDDTAISLGSGEVPVLATPRLVAWVEAAAVAALEGALPEGSTTVGTRIDLHHLAASAVGRRVDTSATVTAVDGRTIEFEVEASDERNKVAAGHHVRVMVDKGKFLSSL